jgi:hypothetical protein
MELHLHGTIEERPEDWAVAYCSSEETATTRRSPEARMGKMPNWRSESRLKEGGRIARICSGLEGTPVGRMRSARPPPRQQVLPAKRLSSSPSLLLHRFPIKLFKPLLYRILLGREL